MAMVPQVWSISALAVEFGRDRRTVATAIREIQPMSRKGKVELYRLTDVLPCLVAAPKPADLEDAKARKLAAEAELAEIELAKARAEVVVIAVAAKLVADEYAAVRAKLLSIPSKLAPMLAIEPTEAGCRALVQRAINEALDELVSAGLGSGDEGGAVDGEGGEPEAASGSDRERMGRQLSPAIL